MSLARITIVGAGAHALGIFISEQLMERGTLASVMTSEKGTVIKDAQDGTVFLPQDAFDEALSALCGARGVLSDCANIQLAIDKLGGPTTDKFAELYRERDERKAQAGEAIVLRREAYDELQKVLRSDYTQRQMISRIIDLLSIAVNEQEPKVPRSSRGRKVGDRVVLVKDGKTRYGAIIEIVNDYHECVLFDDDGTKCVFVGNTMDSLTLFNPPEDDGTKLNNGRTDGPAKSADGESFFHGVATATAAAGEVDQPREVASEDFHVSVSSVVQALAVSDNEGEVQSVATVYIGPDGQVVVNSSEGTPLTLNLLAQAILVANGTIEAAGED